MCGVNEGTITGDCGEKSDNEFRDGTVCTLLNTALKKAKASVRFYQGANYPELIKNLPSLVDEVYQISNKEELYACALLVNKNVETSANAVLTADITVNSGVLKTNGSIADDVSGFRSWTPIGYYDPANNVDYPYSGTFDGNNHTISGLYFNESSIAYVGLFGYSCFGTIKNVGVVDSYFNGADFIGGVCGKDDNGTIMNCYNTSEIISSLEAGGICGLNCGTVQNCYNTGSITGAGEGVYAGGVCGYNEYGTISNCYNTGAVSGSNYVGGVCGSCYVAAISNCYNIGAVSGNNKYVGGVCGYNRSTKISNCYYDSTIYSGNAVGYNTGTVTSVEGKPTADFINCTVCELVGYHQRVLANASGAYEISKACQLHWFANYVNSGNTSANAVLTANITVNLNVLVNGELNANLKNPRKWTPIGNYSKPYTGTFNGKNHTISGLYFKKAVEFVGLFGYNSGTVSNVGVENIYFSGKKQIGGICGTNSSKMES